MFSLAQKHALITGGGSGIGRAIAHLFARQGARVTIVDRDEKTGAWEAGELRATGAQADFVSADISDPAVVTGFAAALAPVDILVNNAGVGHVGSLLETAAADLDRLHAVNVRGTFNLCKAFVPAMLERQRGSVVNLASVAGVVAVRDRLAYTVSKHAIVGLTKALALDHSHTGVRFNAICPGRVETPFVQSRIKEYPDPEKAYREMASTQLNGRMATPDEIAAAALYLAADESAMVTGSNLLIDGGWTAGK
jgi:NAD(P)-dependent dehydrogenase (short-subunit alcohol dehydrogenase family)